MGDVRVVSSLDVSDLSKHGSSHIEGPSTAFGTSLNYCAIRILGMGADHPVAVKARGCLHKLGQFAAKAFVSHSSSFLVSPSNKVLLWVRPPGVNFGCPSWVCTSGKETILSPRNSGTTLSSSTTYCRYLPFFQFRVLPEWLPFHPHRWWIHCRMVYLPMSYLYGSRFKAKETDLIISLREV